MSAAQPEKNFVIQVCSALPDGGIQISRVKT